MKERLLIYGATGYSGRLVVQEALRRGLRPVLSGRNAEAVRTLAAAHGLEARPARLDDAAALGAALADVGVVLHCAGPFSATSAPMRAACLASGTHYLDITGEIAVFEAIAAEDARARAAGVVLMPGVGFDVVPTDCLAAHLKRRLPGAVELTLAFAGSSSSTHGTAYTSIEQAGEPGLVRRGGRIVPVPIAWRTMRVDFGDRTRTCVSVQWGDVSTAYHSTGIPDVMVLSATSPSGLRMLRVSRWLAPLLRTEVVRDFLRRRVDRAPAGPSAESLATRQSRCWGEARDAAGASVRARIAMPSGYLLTAMTAVRAAQAVLAGAVAPGFQTPSRALGPDFILEIPGTVREDLP